MEICFISNLFNACLTIFKMASYDLLGNIAIVKFEKGEDKKKIAGRILKEHNAVKTVLEKAERVKGRLRKIKTKWVAGEKNKISRYKENGCVFVFDVDETYFSSRLSGERLEVAGKVKRKDSVLVLFAGVAPYSIVIAKLSKCKRVVSVELNKKASKYAEQNVKLNKVDNRVEVLQKDVKKLNLKEKFDVIVMPRPRLSETFLSYIWKFCKKGTTVYYYGFGRDPSVVVDEIKKEAEKGKKKIKIMRIKKAGEIAPYKYRWRVDFRIN